MKKVLYVTNLPAPYKVTFFNLLSREVELTVVYKREKASDAMPNGHLAVNGAMKKYFCMGKILEWNPVSLWKF